MEEVTRITGGCSSMAMICDGQEASCYIIRRAAKALPLQILANKLPGSARRIDSTQHHHVREMFPIKQEMMTRLEMKTFADDEVPNGFKRAWPNT